MNENISYALEVLNRVEKGTDTLDQQTAKYILEYIDQWKYEGLQLKSKNIELQDKLHHRNMQIKELKKKIEEMIELIKCQNNSLFLYQEKEKAVNKVFETPRTNLEFVQDIAKIFNR